ncbi:hypothetical protein ACJMK2_021159 [Sinanodonta woodiana]|uniref:Uncharacterized protein n=1 Tax=Sinanodonta woodiana TaxID=1069815 RepID=A0ABD3U1D3_SINWO
MKVNGKLSSDIETLQYELEIYSLSPNQVFEQLVENTLLTGIMTGVEDIHAAGDKGYITESEDESGMSIVLPILDVEDLKTQTLLTSFENKSSKDTVLKAEADSSNGLVTI